MKLDILAIGAHPDDVELGCAATIAKEIYLGRKVGILDLTLGELGTRGDVNIRKQEATEAANILGVSVRENLAFEDGFFVNDKNHQLEVIKIIRKYQPKIVLCSPLEDRHIDHPKAGRLVSDACFLSGLRKIKTFLDDKIQKVWRPKNVFHYIQWNNLEPDFVVDITGFLELKIKAVKAYSSQFYNTKSKEPKTPVSTKNFSDSIIYRAKDFGRIIGVDSGEGFTSKRCVAVKSLDNLI